LNVLFLGGPFPKEMEPEILRASKGAVHYAANNFQWNFIDGFMSLPDVSLRVLSAPFVGTFPKEYRRLFVRGAAISYRGSVPCEYVPFNNLWGYRNLSRKRALKRAIRPFTDGKSTDKVIIVYSPHTPFLEAAVYAKREDPSIHICLVVPDLPEYMNLFEKKSLAYRLFKKFDIRMFEKLSARVDSFVLVTRQMKERLNVGTRPFVIVEGTIASPGSMPVTQEETGGKKARNGTKTPAAESGKRRIVYAGTLKRKFGILNLVQAFHALTDADLELVICGRGDAEDAIVEYAQKDFRIRALGQISAEESAALIRSATVLVNPRQNNEEYTKYSFPIKTMEYLLSGVPVVAYELDGMPEDYKDHIFFVEDDSVEALGRRIEEVLNMPENVRREFGLSAREFVIRNKTGEAACERIIRMIRENRK